MSFPGIPSLDAAVMAFIQTHFHNTVTDTVFPIITSLGEAGIGWIVLSLVLLCFKKTRRTGGLVLIAMTVTLLFGELTLKNIICRLRPCNVFTNFPMLIARPTSYSFPSGHTSSSFAAALILTLRHKKVGWLAYIPA
ncbi:phosphatase PAP2 family protein, partial [Hominenteromicrobium sp.]